MRCNKGSQDRLAGPGSDINVSMKSLTVMGLSPYSWKMLSGFSCKKMISDKQTDNDIRTVVVIGPSLVPELDPKWITK